MTNLFKIASLAGVFALGASAASAGTIYADSVVGSGPNGIVTCDTPAKTTDRGDVCNALGAEDVDAGFADGGFTSSGLYDSLLFDFGVLFKGPITIWEVTGGLDPNHIEDIQFTLMNSATGATSAGSVSTGTNAVADGPNRWRIEARIAGLFDSLLITDNSSTPDGFDIDAIAVSPVPVPASAALMLAGLGALGAMRRRKNA